MQVKEIKLNDKIIPWEGVGELKLGNNIFCLRALSSFNSDFDYFFKDLEFPRVVYKNCIDIYFNPYVGKIKLIRFRAGFKGKLWGNVKIGTAAKELYKLSGTDGFEFIEYEDGGLYFGHKTKPYSLFAIVDPEEEYSDSDFEKILELKILSIEIEDETNKLPIDHDAFPKKWSNKYPFERGNI